MKLSGLSPRIKSRLFRSAIALAACLLYFVWWRAIRPYNDGTWRRVQQTGVLRVGMDASYPPFGNVRDEKPFGLDVDIANEIGKRLGVRIEITNMGYDGLYESLHAGQVDALISALSFDPTKLGIVFYSTTYLYAGQIIGSKSGQYSVMPDLDGKTLAVEYGSIGDELARQWQRRLHQITISRHTSSDEAMQAVLDGQADAVLVDMVTARLFTRDYPGLLFSEKRIQGDPYCVAVRNASPDLNREINRAIEAMQKDGTLNEIIKRWLG